MTRKQHLGRKPVLKRLIRDERGVAAVMLTIFLPVIVGFFSFATDMAYVYYTRNALQATAEAAALAATSKLPVRADVVARALAYAEYNMPKATTNNQSVIRDADVLLGYWPSGCVGSSCFKAGTSAGVCTNGGLTVQCNAVQVTAQRTRAYGNPLDLVFVPLITDLAGISTFSVTASAIAMGQPTDGDKWNAIIVQDVSSSFKEEIGDAKKASLALLDCMSTQAAPGSQMGLTVFAETSKNIVSMTSVDTSANTKKIQDAVNGLNICDNSLPGCSGTDVSAGMNTAIKQLCPKSSSCPLTAVGSAKQAMILITDGQPNMCSGKSCDPKKAAEDAAKLAGDEGIDLYTIYYGSRDSDATWLASLVQLANDRGSKGQAFKTPKPSDLASLMQQICQNSHRLVW